MRFWQSRSAETLLRGGKFSLAGSVIDAYNYPVLTITHHAMHVTSDQVPVISRQSSLSLSWHSVTGFAKWRKSICPEKAAADGNAGKVKSCINETEKAEPDRLPLLLITISIVLVL